MLHAAQSHPARRFPTVTDGLSHISCHLFHRWHRRFPAAHESRSGSEHVAAAQSESFWLGGNSIKHNLMIELLAINQGNDKRAAKCSHANYQKFESKLARIIFALDVRNVLKLNHACSNMYACAGEVPGNADMEGTCGLLYSIPGVGCYGRSDLGPGITLALSHSKTELTSECYKRRERLSLGVFSNRACGYITQQYWALLKGLSWTGKAPDQRARRLNGACHEFVY